MSKFSFENINQDDLYQIINNLIINALIEQLILFFKEIKNFL